MKSELTIEDLDGINNKLYSMYMTPAYTTQKDKISTLELVWIFINDISKVLIVENKLISLKWYNIMTLYKIAYYVIKFLMSLRNMQKQGVKEGERKGFGYKV